MSAGSFVVRRAVPADLPTIAQLAAALVHLHHDTDPDRFLLVDDVAKGYERWLSSELARDDAVLLAAWRADRLVGYAYGALEGRNWPMLLDSHGAIHDLFVATADRRGGVGRALVDAMVRELESKGAVRIVLSTMVSNEAAQHLFRSCGFRPTMLEMTRTPGRRDSAR